MARLGAHCTKERAGFWYAMPLEGPLGFRVLGSNLALTASGCDTAADVEVYTASLVSLHGVDPNIDLKSIAIINIKGTPNRDTRCWAFL